jgi:hypothetical protein
MPMKVDLQSAAITFLSSEFAIKFTVAVVVFLVIISVTSASLEDADSPKSLPGYSFFHITSFFRKRYNFLNSGFQATGQNVFQFNLLRVRLYYLAIFISLYSSVEHGCCCLRRECKTNFLYRQGPGFNRRLQIPFRSCGYFALLTQNLTVCRAQIPIVRGVTSDLQMRRICLIHKRLTSVQRNASLSSCE